MELKPFNLEQAKNGAPVYTRDGRPAEIVKFDRVCDGRYPVVALVTMYKDDPQQTACYYTSRGTLHEGNQPSDLDLMMEARTRVGYINLYRAKSAIENAGDDFYSDGIIFWNENVAKMDGQRRKERNYVKTVKIEWED